MIEITEVDTYCMLDNEKYSMFCFSESPKKLLKNYECCTKHRNSSQGAG